MERQIRLLRTTKNFCNAETRPAQWVILSGIANVLACLFFPIIRPKCGYLIVHARNIYSHLQSKLLWRTTLPDWK